MQYIQAKVTQEANFYGKLNPVELIEKYGGPLYIYSERILRERCRDIKRLMRGPNFIVNYSAKANSNLSLLKIIKDEGCCVDAMSPGEIYVQLQAGFQPAQILYIGNNVSAEEMNYAINQGIQVSVDSLSQLELYGKINPHSTVVARFNTGVGAGHHKKVVTGGEKTKFGIETAFIPEVKDILQKYHLRLIGINQHIGSHFMDTHSYISGVQALLDVATQFPDLEFIDLGGGFGIPYHKYENEQRLDLAELSEKLEVILTKWVNTYGKQMNFKVEPGRYLVAECGILLGKVHTVKTNYMTKYIGTDLGFNVLMRPVLYNSYHDIEIYRSSNMQSRCQEAVTIVGNICESGDIIAEERKLPEVFEEDIIGVLDAGAYGYSMASNYNNRLRPAEVLITTQGDDVLIRQRETLEDLVRHYNSNAHY
ncbi:diaminopimelate decarboxylase [Sporomusa malonica]|uniref:Diaminopimelate decarboxylase n=1 Tax=Sporomusa malonica TaxID=112901 RepID=A0A1W2BPK9_9FIRM|nr:diaminopimelate decarboxylase [Sporomusa malonica]SMC74895.1 diaminopimelate decarboxylase [Sporomusa malonica]